MKEVSCADFPREYKNAREAQNGEKNMKKLFAKLITPLAFAAVVIFAGCSDPSSSGADNVDVPKGSVIAATYSGGVKHKSFLMKTAL